MNQDHTGTANPLAPEGASTTNENKSETPNQTTVESVPPATPTTDPITPPSTPTPTTDPKKPKGLITTVIILAILALAGIGASIYFAMDSNNKSSQISDLKSDLTAKEVEITDLNTNISNLEAEISSPAENENTTESTNTSEATQNTSESTAQTSDTSIDLISEITETETTKVYKIGDCSADGGTGASPHFSLKCQVTISGKDALISYHGGENTLRLSLPKD